MGFLPHIPKRVTLLKPFKISQVEIVDIKAEVHHVQRLNLNIFHFVFIPLIIKLPNIYYTGVQMYHITCCLIGL